MDFLTQIMGLQEEIINGTKNEVIRGNGFYVSYAKTSSGDTEDETALCYKGDYFILNGDHRKQYKKIIKKGYRECKKYFKDNSDQKSSWSD